MSTRHTHQDHYRSDESLDNYPVALREEAAAQRRNAPRAPDDFSHRLVTDGGQVEQDAELPTLEFSDRNVDAILDGEKTLTFRYELGETFDPYEIVSLVDENGREFSKARIVSQFETVLGTIPGGEIVGHRDYTSIGELLSELREYYPDAKLSKSSTLDVVVFSSAKAAMPVRNRAPFGVID